MITFFQLKGRRGRKYFLFIMEEKVKRGMKKKGGETQFRLGGGGGESTEIFCCRKKTK